MTNQYLEGSLSSVRAEVTSTDLRVTGNIPEFLDGRYLRNGPNPLIEIDPETYHWFMGDGMVHGIRLREGKAEWYRNRLVRTPRVARHLGETASRVSPRFGSAALGANTNVLAHAGRTLALVEGGIASYELTDELDTVGPCDFDGTVHGGYVAHPKRDPRTGELHAVSYSFARGHHVQYTVIDVHGHARKAIDIPVNGSPMMHDFSLTEKYVVLYDLPVTFDARRASRAAVPFPLRTTTRLLLSAIVGRIRIPDPLIAMSARAAASNGDFPYSWNPTRTARVGLMPREGSGNDVRWFEVAPCYVFHPLNAYDDGETVVLDLVRHPRMFDTGSHGPDEGDTTLDRWIVNTATGLVTESRLDDHLQEFPRIDERLTGLSHRFGYSAQLSRENNAGCAVLKHDLKALTVQERSFGRGTEPGEFVFVPRDGASDEDDGVLMGLVYDKAADASDLRIIDAGTLEDVAEVRLPQRAPHGFHGNWCPTEIGG